MSAAVAAVDFTPLAGAVTDEIAAHPPEDDDAEGLVGNDNQFVTFVVAGEMFAVPIAPVQEIIRVPDVSRLPLAPAVLDGLANLRGHVLPIVNLRRLFGCDERVNDDSSRALVVNVGQPLGFVVDRVASVVTIEPDEIESSDSIQSIVKAEYLKGVIKRPRADGGHDMLLSIDFAGLVAEQFDRVGASRGSERQGSSVPRLSDDAVAAANDELRLVSFAVAGQEYALDIAQVQEIVQLPETISALPGTPGHVLGVISLRQRLLPLVSLRSLFGLPAVPYSEQQRIVVTSLPGGLHAGLVTDSVKEVLTVPRAQADPVSGMLAAADQSEEISAICRLEDGKRLVSILAAEKLLNLPMLAKAMDAADAVSPEESMMKDDSVDTDTPVEEDMQVVIFRLGDEEFGVPIMSVQEIVRVPETLTRVPKTPAFVEGVINLRGMVLPVIDQRSRLGMSLIERNDRQRIMVYLLGGMRTGFIVDSVAEVLRIPRAQVVSAPAMSIEQSRLISQVANLEGAKRLVMLIEPEHLLERGEIRAVGQMGSSPSRAPPVPLAEAA